MAKQKGDFKSSAVYFQKCVRNFRIAPSQLILLG